MKPKATRLLAAILLAPLSVPVLFFSVIAVLGGSIHEALQIGALAMLFSSLGFAVIGLPSFFMLQRARKATVFALVAVGAIGGAITMLVFFTLIIGFSTWQYVTLGDVIGQLLWGSGLGACVALSLCLIAGITLRSTGRAPTTARAG